MESAISERLTVRQLSPDDAAAYRAVRLRALAECPTAFTSSAAEEARTAAVWSMERLAPHQGRCVLGAFAAESLVGTAGVERLAREKERHKAVLFGMYVAPERAGRGIGMQLVDAVLTTARAWGVAQVQLTATAGNDAALRLYARAGFVTFGIERQAIKVDGVYYDKHHMVRFLD